jgi:hypothetical protein
VTYTKQQVVEQLDSACSSKMSRDNANAKWLSAATDRIQAGEPYQSESEGKAHDVFKKADSLADTEALWLGRRILGCPSALAMLANMKETPNDR